MKQTCLKRLNSGPLPDTDPAKKGKHEKGQLVSTSAVPAHIRKEWDQALDSWYPNYLERAHFLPSVYMNQTQLITKKISDVEVQITHAPVRDAPQGSSDLQESAVRNDQTQQRLLHCLKILAKQRREPMMIIVELDYGKYLSDIPDTFKLPRPIDLKKENKHRGDFDLLIIHRFYGVFVAEIKSVGDISESMASSKTSTDEMVSKKITQALKQLGKSATVLRHMFSDLHTSPRISTILMVPNVPKALLQNVINNCPNIGQDLSKCVTAGDRCDPVDTCLCADNLPDPTSPLDVTHVGLKNFTEWWERTIVSAGPDLAMTDELYRELLRRFAGPPTKQKSDLHTIAEAVSVTGDEFSRVVLNCEQEQLLTSQDPLVFITGPPGTGKTLALTLKGKAWSCLRNGVILLSTWSGSLAASLSIQHSIEKMNEKAGHVGHVELLKFDLKAAGQVQETVDCLVEAATKHHELRVIVDEAYCGGSEFEDLCTKLIERIPNLCLWGASIYYRFAPACLREVTFSEPLRTPPTVTGHVQRSEIMKDGYVMNYKTRETPPPSWGPRPFRLEHKGREHSRRWPADCKECGKILAEELMDLVAKGIEADAAGKSAMTSSAPRGSAATTSSSTSVKVLGNCKSKPLTFSDVFILTITTSYDGLKDEKVDEEGNVKQEASGMVRGLRDAGIPVRIVEAGDVDALEDVVKMTGPNAVIAADADTIRGLERKIVVWVQADRKGESSGEEDFGRLDAMSRTNALLIVVS